MKIFLFAVLLLSGLACCSGPAIEKPITLNAPASVTSPVPARPEHRPLSMGRVDTVDHFFYTDAHYKEVGELNRLDMFRLESGKVLAVCGKEVEHLRYKPDNTIAAFLAQNLKQTAGLDLSEVRIIEWSSNLSGDDEKLFFFKQGRLKKIREQNAPDLVQLRDTW